MKKCNQKCNQNNCLGYTLNAKNQLLILVVTIVTKISVFNFIE